MGDSCADGSLLDQWAIRLALIVLYSILFFAGVFGNAFTIVVITVHRSMRTATNFFLANLAIADLFVAAFCIPPNMYQIVGSDKANWPFGDSACRFYVFILHLAPSAAFGSILLVSGEKYIAILHPLTALKWLTSKLRVTLMIFVWIIAILFNLPYIVSTKELRFKEFAACIRDLDGPFNVPYLIGFSFTFWYCFPLILLVFAYTRIGAALWQNSLTPLEVRYAKGDSENAALTFRTSSEGEQVLKENSRNFEETLSHANTDVIESRKRVIRLLIAIVLNFAVLTLPHHIRLLYIHFSEVFLCNSHWSALIQPATWLSLFLSSAINPLIYAFLSQRFRNAVKDIARCRRKRSRTRTILSDVGDGGSPTLSVASP